MMISLLNGILIKLGVLEQQLNVSAFNLNKSDCHISAYARRLGWEEKAVIKYKCTRCWMERISRNSYSNMNCCCFHTHQTG